VFILYCFSYCFLFYQELNCVSILAGVIDQDYRGNVGVVLFNFGQEPFKGKLNNSCVIAII